MKCGRASAWISLYVDGNLDVRRLSRLEQHLVTCPECRRDLARLRLMQSALSDERLVDEPVGLHESVMRRISAYEAQRASDAATQRQRAAARKAAKAARKAEVAERKASGAQPWLGVGVRRGLALVCLLALLIAWAQMTRPALLSGAAQHFGPNLLQLLVLPGPYQIAWSVWIAGVALALGVFAWFARADASEDLRRALAERLPQLW
ncbi:MAG TPA: anti-sigma factor [Ktedonobacterales bacterium]|nr:anti-sigma factor [Ktedonobacterales bacterium]